MKLDLSILGFAAAGAGAERLPDEHRVALPEPKGARGGGRLPRLALELAERALVPTKAQPTGVLFGTALGCLTETEAFVGHMLRENEATPKPRAFSSSVHNACASFVALNLGARGECTTFVHGELSFVHALFAAARARARGGGVWLVGAADEAPTGTFARLAGSEGLPEGGALFALGTTQEETSPLAWFEELAFGRAEESSPWAEDLLARLAPELVLTCGFSNDPMTTARVALPPRHASDLATASALAAALVSGAVAPPRGPRPRRVAVLARSSSGEAALVSVVRGLA